jgi:phosphate transport system ATP-binding protein
VVYSLRLVGERNKKVLDQSVEENLRKAALWDETKDRLHESALSLSGGQMQRLCIARAIACKPRVLLMDEPCSALDPIATAKVEELMDGLRAEHTIIIVTHSMAQAQRTADFTAFFYLGKVVEHAPTQQLFANPAEQKTLDYLEGRFG